MMTGNKNTNQKQSSMALNLRRFAGFLVVGGFIAGSVIILHLRAAAQEESAASVLPVSTVLVERVDSYSVSERYSGRIEPAQAVNLAFEQPGKIAGVRVEEGSVVQKGHVIATLDLALLKAAQDQAQAALSRVTAQLELAEVTEKRQKALFEQGHANQQRYDEARLNTVTLRAQLAEAKAALESTSLNIEKATLYAPFDGIIARRMVDVGSVQAAGGPIVSMMETGRDRARFSLPSKKAQILDFDRSYEAQHNRSIIALKVAAIRSDVDAQTRTQDVLFDVVQAPSGTRSYAYGDLLSLSLAEVRSERGYWVPAEALVEGDKGLWTIYAVEQGEKGTVVVRRAVEVLHAEVDRVFIRANLGARAEVIGTGVHRVVPGQTVEAMRRGQS